METKIVKKILASSLLLSMAAVIHPANRQDDKGVKAKVAMLTQDHSQDQDLVRELNGLLERNSNSNLEAALMKVVENNMEWAIQPLLNKGVNINFFYGRHETVLVEAARNGYAKIVSALINAGALVNAVDEDGHTALMYAALGGHIKAVQILIGAGAQIDVVGRCGGTALLYAASNGHTAIVQALIVAGERMDSVSNRAILIEAARGGHARTVYTLIAHGADVNFVDQFGNTALMWAAIYGDTGSVDALIGAGAAINHVNNLGCSSLAWAASRGRNNYVEIVRLLVGAYRRQLAVQYPEALLAITHEDLRRLNEHETKTLQSMGRAFNEVGEGIAGYLSDGDLGKLVSTHCAVLRKSAINGRNIQSQRIKEKLFRTFIMSGLKECVKCRLDFEKCEEMITILGQVLQQGYVVPVLQPVCAMAAREQLAQIRADDDGLVQMMQEREDAANRPQVDEL